MPNVNERPRLREFSRDDSHRKTGSSRINLVLISLAIVAVLNIFFLVLGARPLADYDEAIYAQVAREALDSHSPFAFTWRGNVGLGRPSGWYEKPPLMIWLTELSFFFGGHNEFAARLPAALFSVATVVLACLWAQDAFKSSLGAAFTASVFLIAFQFLLNSSTLQIDIPVGFFILLSLYAFARARRDQRYFYLFWFSIGLGVMTKSIIGLLPIPIALLASVLIRDYSCLRSRSFYGGIIAFFAIALPWHLVETIQFGKAFWGQYLLYHLLTRWSTGIEGNGQPFQFYWDILVRQRLLFGLFVPSFAYVIYKALKGNMDSALFAAGSVMLFIFFSSSHTKLPGYILPVYPFIALTIGEFLAAVCERLTPRVAIGVVAVGITVCGGLGVKYMMYRYQAMRADQYGRDSRTIGTFLANSNPQLDVYYLSETGTKPSIIYYADRIVYYLNAKRPKPEPIFLLVSEVKPAFPSSSVILQTPTQALYLIQ